jgi:hypothetical protein
MPLRRRRPVLRAAAVGGGAYYMGKRRAAAQQQEAPAAAEGAPAAVAPGAPATSPAPAGGLDADAVKRLKELADLHGQGVLTDEEFAEQKARILG